MINLSKLFRLAVRLYSAAEARVAAHAAALKKAMTPTRRRWQRARGRGRVPAAESVTRQRLRHALRTQWYASLRRSHPERRQWRCLARAFAAREWRDGSDARALLA